MIFSVLFPLPAASPAVFCFVFLLMPLTSHVPLIVTHIHVQFQGSHDQSCMSELSANEVEQLLRSATVHRQVNHQNYHQNQSRREEHCFPNKQDERDRVEGRDLRHQRGHNGNHVLRNNMTDIDFSCRNSGVEHRYGHEESHYRRQEKRNNQSNLREGHRPGNYKGVGPYYGNQKDGHKSLYQVQNCVQEDRPASRHNNSFNRSNSMVNEGRANGCPLPQSHHQEVVSPYQPQLCYTPANYIPLRDYISVDEEELYCLSPPSYHSHDGNPATALYSDSAHSDSVPTPLYKDDTPYTILNTMETTEPITAIFMGFQMAQDDSGQTQEFEGSLKAELVIIEDNDDNGNKISMKEKNSQLGSNSCSANRDMGHVEGVEDSWTERRVGPGIRKIKRKHKPCCSVC